MGTVKPVDSKQALTRHRWLIQSLVVLAAGVFVVQISRSSLKVFSPWLEITDVQRNWIHLIPLTLYFAINFVLVRRVRDRVMLACFVPCAILLLSTHIIALNLFGGHIPKLVISLADATALGLLITVMFRNAMLLIRSYRQRHEYILESLALGTSHRVGEDFLNGMVESVATTVDVDLVLITEAHQDDTTEAVVAFSKRDDLALCRLLEVGSKIDCSHNSLASLAPGKDVTVIPLADSEGTPIGHLVLLHKPRTITVGHRYSLQIFASRASAEIQRLQADRENRELQHQVQLAQKMESLGILASGLAHDFNNVLQAIRGYSAMAADSAVPESERHELIGRVDHVVANGAELCNRLLAYAGKSMRQNTVCDINRIVKDSVDIVQAARAERRITTRLADESLCIWGDPAQMIQVVLNLLTNAVDSMDESAGSIVVSTEKTANSALRETGLRPDTDSDCAMIHVTDEGCGIPSADGDRIFDPYFTTKGDGRGIGLAAVAGIVKSHSGDITFRSELNSGTTFTLALPITTAQVQRTPRTDDQPISLQGRTVLLVDDDEQVRKSLSMMLETAGMVVVTAASGAECLQIIDERGDEIELILIDQTMPGTSGLETSGLLRERGCRRPVVLMSGYSEVAIDEEQHQVRFLAKPCSRRTLLRTVAEASVPTDHEPTPARHSA